MDADAHRCTRISRWGGGVTSLSDIDKIDAWPRRIRDHNLDTLMDFDHKHRLRTIRPCDSKVAATLLADFWAEVDGVLKERGAIS